MEPLAEHMRATFVLVMHDHTATGWRHGLIVADPQRAEERAIGTLATQAGLHGGHERTLSVLGAIVITTLESWKEGGLLIINVNVDDGWRREFFLFGNTCNYIITIGNTSDTNEFHHSLTRF